MFPPISAVSVSNSTGFVVGFGFSFEHGSTTKFSLNFDHFKNKITLKLVENVGGFGPDFGTVALPLSWLSIAQLFNWKYFKLSAIVLSFFHTFQTPFSRILFGKWCHEMKKNKKNKKKQQFHLPVSLDQWRIIGPFFGRFLSNFRCILVAIFMIWNDSVVWLYFNWIDWKSRPNFMAFRQLSINEMTIVSICGSIQPFFPICGGFRHWFSTF